MMQRDYIMRMIEDVIQGIARAIERAGQSDIRGAHDAIDETVDHVLGPMRPVVEQMAPRDIAALMAPFDLERVTLYAALVGASGSVYESAGDIDAAARCHRRALELLLSAAHSGTSLTEVDRERVAHLRTKVDATQLSVEHQQVLARTSAPN